MGESKQKWLDRNRPPRVQITYDVEKGGAVEKKEIPFVVGVVSGLRGDNPPANKLKERKFVQIDPDSFNEVLSSICPTLSFSVEDRLRPGGAQLKVDLAFKSIDDFRPEAVAEQVAPLKGLLAARRRLTDLLAKLEGNDELNKSLIDLFVDDDKLAAVQHEVHQA